MSMDRIELKGMEFYGYHGCYPKEREEGQPFLVDVSLQVSLEKAGKSDDLGETVDYGAVFRDVGDIVEGEPRKLIEAVAEDIAGRVLRGYPLVEAVCVTVHKPNAPLPGKFRDASVTVERKR